MTTPLVLVTEPEFRRGARVFGSTAATRCVAAPSEEPALAEAITTSGARHAIVGSTVYRGAVYEALPRGGVLARFGVGHDGIDKARATASGILCTNTPGVLDQSVAEQTIALMLAAARHVASLHASTVAGGWAPREGIELHGKTLVIVGTGRIGGAVARIATAGFGMRVVGCGRGLPRAEDRGSFVAQHQRFDEAVAGADFVSLHIPARDDNRRFVDARRLAAIPAHAWLINTARGSVVDEAALFDALSGGQLAGAALDVFEREPYEPAEAGRDLRTLPNVILQPHTGSNTVDANRGMAERALVNVLAGAAGRFAEMDLLNPEVLTG